VSYPDVNVPDDGPGAVRAALDAILASEPFSDSPQLRAFLKYVVAETLDGRAAELKGYTIATMALGRPASFDPQTDPIVRVQAGRVRQALTEYYAANPTAPVRIELERGVYAPRFRKIGDPLPPAAAPEAASIEPLHDESPVEQPMPPDSAIREAGRSSRRVVLGAIAALALVAIAAFALISRRPDSSAPGGLPAQAESFFPTVHIVADRPDTYPDIAVAAQRLRDAIARFDDMVLVGEMSEAEPPAARPQRTGIDLLLRINGAAAEAGRIRFSARLLDRQDQRVIWSREFEPFPAGAEGDAQRTSIIRSVASTVAQPYGVIHAYVRSHARTGGETADPYGCLVAGFDYWQTNDEKTHRAARDCIVERLRQHPSSGPLNAQLAYLHLEEFRHGYNSLPGDPLARALDSAQAAVRFAPTSARSHQALLAARFSLRDTDGAWRAADEALRLNPDDTDIIADIGARHIQSGRYDEGLAMLRAAFELNPAPPVWAQTYQAIAYYMTGRNEQASLIAAQLETTRFPPAMVATILVAVQDRKLAKAKERLELFRSVHPMIAADLESYLNRLNVDPRLLERALKSYSDARIWIERQ
jgi:Tfp pilus assembly protein PilF